MGLDEEAQGLDLAMALEERAQRGLIGLWREPFDVHVAVGAVHVRRRGASRGCARG